MKHKFKIGDKVRAKDDCNNDFADGEGIIADINGDNMIIKLTKSSRYYSVSQRTNPADWANSIKLIREEKHNSFSSSLLQFHA